MRRTTRRDLAYKPGDVDRFWSNVNKDAPGGCWLSTTVDACGRGVVTLCSKKALAHRFSWLLFFGAPIPDHVRHTCRIETCVNPAHLIASNLHGQCESPEYGSWAMMRHRCAARSGPDYHNYGGRGIAVHPAWQSDFPAFLAYVGPRPTPQHTIDRIDNDRGYEPGNVRWATKAEQTRNRRATKLTQEAVDDIRARISQFPVRAVGVRVLAEVYGVMPNTIRLVVRVKTWRPSCAA